LSGDATIELFNFSGIVMQKIRKAVFPVAGMGTRFLPATKASPKEMLPVVDKPLIQYAVEEAVAAGITELIFITGRNKRSIEDHFDKAYELETELENRNKKKLLELVQEILPANVSCIYIRQAEALGLGHAVLCAKPVVGDEPFAVILADDLIAGEPGAMEQMVRLFDDTHSSVLGVETVAREETGSYGIVEVQKNVRGHQEVASIVEKPHPDVAPSNLAVVGRYILTARIFDKLINTVPGAGGEIQLTDGIAALMKDEPVLALPFQGKRYDCGSKLGYLKATVEYGLQHHEVGADFTAYLNSLQRG
jgi:UTP--glucose-1-phosphate uridylyltransferase